MSFGRNVDFFPLLSNSSPLNAISAKFCNRLLYRSSSAEINALAKHIRNPEKNQQFKIELIATVRPTPYVLIHSSNIIGPKPRPKQFIMFKTAIDAPLDSGEVRFKIITLIFAPFTAPNAHRRKRIVPTIATRGYCAAAAVVGHHHRATAAVVGDTGCARCSVDIISGQRLIPNPDDAMTST